MLTAISFILITLVGMLLALGSGPFWGLLIYTNLYFNTPDPAINWWAGYLPPFRWGVVVFATLLASLFLHRHKLIVPPLAAVKWQFPFLLLSAALTLVTPAHDSMTYLYYLCTYVVISLTIITTIPDNKYYHWFSLTLIIFATNLSFNAYLYGKRDAGRLEGIGSADANGSNEFALLLAAILPLLLPFLLKGKKIERVVCLLALPILANAFILCNSRGAFMALMLACLLSLFFVDRNSKKIIAIAAFLCLPLFLYLADQEFIERISSLVGAEDAMGDATVASQLSSGRTEIWYYGWQMAKDHPLGAGLNGFKHIAHLYLPPALLNMVPVEHGSLPYGIRAAHNTYLQVLVEQGVIGLLLWLGMCFHALIRLATSLRSLAQNRSPGSKMHLSLLALIISILVSMLGGLFTSRLYYEFFWWQIALATIVTSPAFLVQTEKRAGRSNPQKSDVFAP